MPLPVAQRTGVRGFDHCRSGSEWGFCVIITVRNWSTFQHYKNRSPPWIRLHRELLDNFEFQCLPVASRALAPMLWLLASCSESVKEPEIDATPSKLAFRLRTSESEIMLAIKPLIDAGFFIVLQDASGVLARCGQLAVPETETETETEERACVTSDDVLPAKPKREQIGTRLPDDWQPDASLTEWAATERPDLNLAREIAGFRDYWHSRAGKDARKASWPLTFRNWIRNSRNGSKPQTQIGGSRAAGRLL